MQTGIFDRTRLVANTLMVLLVALNIFFTVQYTTNIKEKDQASIEEAQKIEYRLQTARFMKFFIDTFVGTDGSIEFGDRIKLEADLRDLKDDNLTKQWETWVNSSTLSSEEQKQNAVRFMSMLANKMI